ncbi:NADH-quinone oxidoreductase subunit N [Maridesulfovibrio hydrothermalis]|uniref:NADH-quinone oxidoreductase subunit N n=1 Tax=Maridesulfovibrio hydrothermalis AM13 = DSM 14728 TaxID=1121451 RepID=L0RE59_9BACT|nr:NADH-quinone oxidoreductase subunit N [Maridesulfovibrio hydrothermalis]CCO25044.1 NADH-quinone oxidoreductase subunit N 2 [Maridesulfovibrio hydrothermalis AM13 = DSM 14728]
MNVNPYLFLPELFQFLIIALLFVQTVGSEQMQEKVGVWLPIASAVGVLVAVVSVGQEGLVFNAAYRIDPLSQFFKAAIAVGFFVTVLNATRQPTLDKEKSSDYFLFLALSAWGLMLLASSVELITMYLALELSSYSLYAVIALRADSKGAAEAAIKYILFGAVATALALYGFSYILAGMHTTYLAELVQKTWTFEAAPMAVTGMALFLAGMFYKLALFPFHFWCPDVYEGASNETAAFVATLPKLGAVVILIRLAAMFKPGYDITTLLAVLGALSMTFGNLAALAQTDVKRILGYSSVAHAGYIMIGLVSGTPEGLAAASFYALAYVAMNLTCFWVVSRVAVDGRNLQLSDLDGLHKRAPALAFALAVGAFALVGLPPMAGFMGKLFLFSAGWNHGYNWLIIIAGINTAISIYYYLGLVRHAYTNDASDEVPMPDTSTFSYVGAAFLSILVLGLGLMPSDIFDFALQVGGIMP